MRKFSKIKESKTNPLYKKGEILACFKSGLDSNVIKYFIKKIGGMGIKKDKYGKNFHPSLGSDYNAIMHDVYVLKVPIGKEKESIKNLQNKMKDDLEWSERRNVKFELRTYFSDFISGKLRDLGENTEIGDSDWKNQYNHLIEIMRLVAEDKFIEIRATFKEFDKKFEEI